VAQFRRSWIGTTAAINHLLTDVFNCQLDSGLVRRTACTLCYVAVANVCHFPAYLHRASSASTATATGAGRSTAERSSPGDSQWVTELRYSPMTAAVQSRLDIVVFDTEMTAKVSFAVQCQARSSSASENQLCYQTELVYRRSCVERFSANKFKVVHNEGL